MFGGSIYFFSMIQSENRPEFRGHLYNKVDQCWLQSWHSQKRNPPNLLPFGIYKDFIYPLGYNYALRKKIRNRDNLTCQYCGDKKTPRSLYVHHIDYDKRNSKELNLISLCFKCHKSTNYERLTWHRYFWDRMNR